MVQVHVPMAGALTPCSCGLQPKHYHVRGKELDFLECPPCGVRTAKYPMLQQAVEAWENNAHQMFDARNTA